MGHKPPKISFEFFPPKSLQASFDLWESLNVLAPLNPEFVSVTYGAAGTTRQLTKEMTETIGKSYGLDVAAHLTCVNASKAETLAIAKSYVDAGVKQIVALRGDAPQESAGFCRILKDLRIPLILSPVLPPQRLKLFMLAPIPNHIPKPAVTMPILTG